MCLQVLAGHLKETEEENFVLQAEKIVVTSKNKTAGSGPTGATTTTEQPQETKPDRTEPQTQSTVTTSETTSAKIGGQPTPRLAPRESHQLKSSSPLSNSVADTSQNASQQSDCTSRTAKIVNEVASDVTSESTGTAPMPSKSDSDKERERPGRVAEVSPPQQRPLTRDAATGMSPATSSSSVALLGSQSSREEGGSGRKMESSPSLSSQTSDEVCDKLCVCNSVTSDATLHNRALQQYLSQHF